MEPESRQQAAGASPNWEPLILICYALIVGIIAGLGAIFFRWLIQWISNGFHILGGVTTNHLIVATFPAIGLLLVGLISTYLAREVKGHGVPQILEAVAVRGGYIRKRVGVLGVLAPALTIGSGGSVGREGPIALIGASFGSIFGQFLRLPDKYKVLLVACGAAGGIAATFNAPIAGAFFGLEIVLGSYAMGAVVPVFIAALMGVTVFNHFEGGGPVLAIPAVGLHNPIEIFFMFGLGILGGLLGVAYTWGLYFSEDVFDHWRVPWWVKNVSGGLALGILGLFLPQILGVGYSTMHLAVLGKYALAFFFLLLVAKYLATILTIGAGGSGGVFAPSLYLGAMMGGFYGSVLHTVFPQLVTSPGIYAAVGMAAVFAGAAQAPFVAITIILEMTGNYGLTTAVMGAVIISYIVYGSLMRDSMYTVRLTRKGISILRGTDVRPTDRITVKSVLKRQVETVNEQTTVRETLEILTNSSVDLIAVVNQESVFQGAVSLVGLREAIDQGTEDGPISKLITRLPRIAANQSLDMAMRKMAINDVTALAVFSSETGDFLGILNNEDVLKAYNALAVRSFDLEKRIEQFGKQNAGRTGRFKEFHVSVLSPWKDKQISELPWPSEAVIVSILRGNQTIIPRGNTQMQADDQVLVYGYPEEILKELDVKFEGTPTPGQVA